MKKLLLFLALTVFGITAYSQIIYNFDPKLPVYGGDLLLGTDSATNATVNFMVSDLGAKIFEDLGNTKVNVIAVSKADAASAVDSINNLPAFTIDYDELGVFNVTITDVDDKKELYLLRKGKGTYGLDTTQLATWDLFRIDPYGEDHNINRSNIIAGSNITITPLSSGVSIAASGTVSTDEDNINIINTYSNLGIVPTDTQEDYNTAADTQIGTNVTNIGTNTSGLTSKAAILNVLELDNTSAYTPTLDYHPSTKKYVDDEIAAMPSVVVTESDVGLNSNYTNIGVTSSDTQADYNLAVDNLFTLKQVVVAIGDWDMDTNSIKTVGLVSGVTLANIRGVTIMIYTNSSSTVSDFIGYNNATGEGGSFSYSDALGLSLTRVDGGKFDNTSYNTTGFNRGYVTITYAP